MLTEKREILYTYHWFTKALLCVFIIAFTPLTLLSAAGALAGLILVLSGSPIGEVGFLGGFAFGAFGGGLLLVLFTNTEPNIRISDRGVAVQSFLFWYIFVPWQDVKEIRKTILPGSKSYLIVVRRLTPFHRLIGWTHGYTFQPAFVIRKGLIGYDEAVKLIKQKTGMPHEMGK
jgi:hypothetical protein